MLPPFHGERMRAYEAVMAEATEREVAAWPVGRPLPLQPSMQAITLEVILRAVFGVEDDARRTEPAAQAWSRILATTRSPRAIGMTIGRLRRLPAYRRVAECSPRPTRSFSRRSPSAAPTPTSPRAQDILSMLVGGRFEDGSAMSDAELRDQLMTLLMAGHETTATGLAWAFDLLFRAPDALERLRAELDGGRPRVPGRGDRGDPAPAPRGPLRRPRAARRRPSSVATSFPRARW